MSHQYSSSKGSFLKIGSIIMLQRKPTSIVRSLAMLVLFASLIGLIWSCKEPPGGPHGNTPPDTRLANVPVNDTIALYIRNGAIPEIETT